MSNAQTAAGAIIYIGASAPATYNKTGYESVQWTELGEVTGINGDIGKTFSLATLALLGERGIVKRKGSYNNGSVSVEYAYSRSDNGQDDITAAVDSDSPFPFKIVLPDSDDTHVYFMAMVMGDPISIGTADDFITVATPLEIDSVSDVLEEDAPAST